VVLTMRRKFPLASPSEKLERQAANLPAVPWPLQKGGAARRLLPQRARARVPGMRRSGRAHWHDHFSLICRSGFSAALFQAISVS
jgi:hypothetical protein